MTAKDFKRMFSEIALQNGFKAGFGRWFLESDDCLIVIELQKSNFGNYFDLNMKIYVQGLFGHRYKMTKELVKKDIGHVFVRQPPEFNDVFNLDSQMDQLERKQRLMELFSQVVLPIAKMAKTRSGLVELSEMGMVYLLPAVKKELSA